MFANNGFPNAPYIFFDLDLIDYKDYGFLDLNDFSTKKALKTSSNFIKGLTIDFNVNGTDEIYGLTAQGFFSYLGDYGFMDMEKPKDIFEKKRKKLNEFATIRLTEEDYLTCLDHIGSELSNRKTKVLEGHSKDLTLIRSPNILFRALPGRNKHLIYGVKINQLYTKKTKKFSEALKPSNNGPILTEPQESLEEYIEGLEREW